MELGDVIKNINIVEFISQYVELTQKNGEWWGLSCFKSENTPSFSVREDPPFFYDYSSGIGGNLFNFVKEYFKCSNKDAAKIILDYAGIENTSEFINNKNLTATICCKKYKNKLSDAKQNDRKSLDINYMDRYDFNLEKMKNWADEGISEDSLSMFCVKYDMFTNSIVYPIRDIDGNIVNIGSRTLRDNWKELGFSKYSYFYKWGELDIIYGLYENMEHIKRKKEVIVFEGCKSVLIAYSMGIKNTCALLTSHLNKHQFILLIKLGVKVIFALDKDIDITKDKRICSLKKYVNVEYIQDTEMLIGDKDSPIDKGVDVFVSLYKSRKKLR